MDKITDHNPQSVIEMNDISEILNKPLDGKRITREEALVLMNRAHWSEMVKAAVMYRETKIDPGRASFTMFRIINYTNFCKIGCSFCSFMREPSDKKGIYVLSKEEIDQKITENRGKGVFQIFFQGGVNPELSLDYYTDILSHMKSKYGFHIRAFSPVELYYLAKDTNTPLEKLIRILKEAGLNSVPGAGAEILSDRVRKILSPKKLSAKDWAEVLEKCHEMELFGSANIVFGSIETDEEIIEHLDIVRALQDKTRGFYSFIPWTFQKQTTRFQLSRVSPHNYLKMLALCRLYLDNIDNIEASILGMGKELGELALNSGANDISSPVFEENVLRSFGVKTEEEAVNFIRNAGFEPFLRDFNYKMIREYKETSGVWKRVESAE